MTTHRILGVIFVLTLSGCSGAPDNQQPAQPQIVKQLKQGTADLAYVPGSKTVIVPNMNENNVAAYDLAGALQ